MLPAAGAPSPRRDGERAAARVCDAACYARLVSRSIHVRLDDASQSALGVVRAEEGGTDSEAVRAALREAAGRRRRRASLRAEVHALLGDEDDAREMRLIREQMTALAPEEEA